MHTILDIAAYLVAIPVSVALLVLGLECLLALLPSKVLPLGDRAPCVVLIPAHNEEQGIEKTLANVRVSLEPGDRLVVVADNCSDATASIARTSGAEVVVRDDPKNRGKGFALAAGVEHIKASRGETAHSPSVLVVLDADCEFADSALDRLVRITSGSEVPIQALYLLHVSPSGRATQRLSAFAFLTKNRIRPRGLTRAGLPVPLTGSGMAFPWKLADELLLGSSEIVEDLDLGLRLVRKGLGPRFCETAQVDSVFPDSDDAAKEQHARWELGYIGQMRHKLPGLLSQGLRGDFHALATGLDLLVPPLSLLMMLSALTGGLLTTNVLLGGSTVPFWIFICTSSLASLGLALVWFRFGRQTISFIELLGIPSYAGKKIAMYATAPFKSPKQWKRTARN
ncbi:MAG: glycosyltransferase family 2 protein [Aureliella sp.]